MLAKPVDCLFCRHQTDERGVRSHKKLLDHRKGIHLLCLLTQLGQPPLEVALSVEIRPISRNHVSGEQLNQSLPDVRFDLRTIGYNPLPRPVRGFLARAATSDEIEESVFDFFARGRWRSPRNLAGSRSV